MGVKDSMSISKIIKEYTSSIYVLEKRRKQLSNGTPLDMEDAITVSGMISDLRYALEWMKRGRRPGNLKGAERVDIYRQRELYREIEPMELSDEDRRELAILLLSLSERERQCFLLHMAQGLTYSEIGVILKVSIRSVRSYIDRAKSKVQQGITT